MGKMSRTEEAALLEKKAKSLRRAEQDFLMEADRRKDELLDRWNIHQSNAETATETPRFPWTGFQGADAP